MNRILIIDDEPNSALALGMVLYEHGYEVKVEQDSARALETAWEFQPSVVLIDFMMPKAHGGEVAWQLHADPALKDTKLILYSGLSPEEVRPKLPPRDIPILEKPVDAERLLRLLE
ncbi:MAG: response regulator [Chthoniobacter sp.]|nr:response regulator [Chthoniobacter sp.]